MDANNESTANSSLQAKEQDYSGASSFFIICKKKIRFDSNVPILESEANATKSNNPSQLLT